MGKRWFSAVTDGEYFAASTRAASFELFVPRCPQLPFTLRRTEASHQPECQGLGEERFRGVSCLLPCGTHPVFHHTPQRDGVCSVSICRPLIPVLGCLDADNFSVRLSSLHKLAKNPTYPRYPVIHQVFGP